MTDSKHITDAIFQAPRKRHFEIKCLPNTAERRRQKLCEAFSALNYNDVMMLVHDINLAREDRSKEHANPLLAMAEALNDVLLVEEHRGG
ncbi:hypothetical protein [Marivivens aquimaris]|uniref:hypothetical protein n=1 Tax=Marivivens aquimaris TaxID=2774876 RepID=UPI00188285F2|nr:hypothetical protein [Marivivens aquimaris]